MKSASVSLCVLIVMCAGSSARAQCGCGGYYSAPPMVSQYVPRPVAPPVRPTMSPSSIAFVNELSAPIARANYTLKYAIHLTDGRILLSDVVPQGYTVRGMESQTGTGGRRLNTNSMPTGGISLVDPLNNSTVATFPANR